jgi:hypothetical protein
MSQSTEFSANSRTISHTINPMNPAAKQFINRKHQWRRSLLVGSTSRPLNFHNVRMGFTSIPFKQMNVKSKTTFALNVRKVGKKHRKRAPHARSAPWIRK